MEDLLIRLLETFKLPVYRQGSIGKNEPYPDTFFTFWNMSTPDGSHYDNEPLSYIGTFSVNIYSTNPQTTYDTLEAARALLRQNGFIIDGLGYDAVSDEETHTGRGFEAIYQQFNNLTKEEQNNGN